MGLSKYNTSIYLSELAQIYLDSSDFKNAEKYALHSLDEYGNQPRAMYILGCIHAANKKWIKATEWFMKSLDLDYKNARTHLSLAQVKQKQKKTIDAQAESAAVLVTIYNGMYICQTKFSSVSGIKITNNNITN